MHSIRAKITLMTVCAIVVVMTVATCLGVAAIQSIGSDSSNQSLLLLCEVGEKNLDYYFENVEQSVEKVSAYAESDLDGVDDEHLQEHLDRVSDFFKRVTYKTDGILTYYYRIDPSVSASAKGFWYVNAEGQGFEEYEVTDITQYDTADTSQLVWFTVPKSTDKAVWLSPYITDNLGHRVISYNVPVYRDGTFVGVIGIEIDYSTMADQVDNITLYENGYAFINDDEGSIIYHPQMDVIELTGEKKPTVPDGLLSDDKYIRYTYEGVEKQAVWLPLSNGMRLNVTVPVSEVNAHVQQWVIEIVVVFAVMLLVFVFLIAQFARHLTRPLKELTEAAEQVNVGNYDFELTYKGDDEVGVLTRAFIRLSSNLKTYISDLNNRAYVDALTSVRNKGAFDAYVKDLQVQLQNPNETNEFAVCIFDCNDLKMINDRYGHEKGDIYLKASCALICEVFEHSPVFRIGGDEFAAFLLNDDYRKRSELVRFFEESCARKREAAENRWEQVDIAQGMATYDSEVDRSVDETIRRADKLMYENKRGRKAVN